MNIELSVDQKEFQAAIKKLVDEHIVPDADRFDRDEHLPDELIQTLGKHQCLTPAVPANFGGGGKDAITQAIIYEEIGRGSASVGNLATVSGMVANAILRFGSRHQKETWLPRLARGQVVGAYALTEPDVGSDAARVATTATRGGSEYLLHGRKKWISFAQRADFYVVFAQCDHMATAFLVERDRPNLAVQPISGLLGLRGSMLGELHLDGCPIPEENRIGGEGMGFSWVAASSLDQGRFSTACGSVGLAQACLDACMAYTQERRQFGELLRNHPLIQRLLADMIANVSASRLLCYQAACLRQRGDPRAIQSTMIAKYFASTKSFQSAADAVQIHGANGCGSQYPVQRYLRDAKIMEIIEGTTQIHQMKIVELAQ